MKKSISSVSAKAQKYTQKELGFTCIKPINGEYFAQYRCRQVYVSTMGRVIATDFQGRGYETELDYKDRGNGIVILPRRSHFFTSGESLNKMVAEVFLENPDGCKSVRYLDGNYHNCKLSNLYYYHGNLENADKTYPTNDIFEKKCWFPFNIGDIGVCASGIVATTKKKKWNKGERLRRLETMHITKVEKTITGYKAIVVDGGGAVSNLSVNNGYFTLITSWGSCITVRRLNQSITGDSDLAVVLNAMTHFYSDFVKTECPMELVDVHIEELSFSECGEKECESASGMAA